jgi:hypothetical protein
MEITIRPAQPGDIPRMTDLLAELFRIESDFNPDVHKQMKGLSLLVADPSDLSLILVAVMNRKIVGMARSRHLSRQRKAAMSDWLRTSSLTGSSVAGASADFFSIVSQHGVGCGTSSVSSFLPTATTKAP